MLKQLAVIMIALVVGHVESVMAMNNCFEFTYAACANAGNYLDRVARQHLDDHCDPQVMSAILAHNYDISQEQIEVIRHGLNDYNDPEIRAIIVANNYQMPQRKIDVIKHAVKSAIIYYDVHDNFVMVTRGDNKVINAHTKVQHCMTRKNLGTKFAIPYNVYKMPALSEDDCKEEENQDDRSAFAFRAGQDQNNHDDLDDYFNDGAL